jgi:hypothetical protein
METSTKPFRGYDKHLANRVEADAADLRDRFRYGADGERSDAVDDHAKLEPHWTGCAASRSWVLSSVG